MPAFTVKINFICTRLLERWKVCMSKGSRSKREEWSSRIKFFHENECNPSLEVNRIERSNKRYLLWEKQKFFIL